MNPSPSSPPPPAPFSSELKVDEIILNDLIERKKEIKDKLTKNTITSEAILNLEPHPSDHLLVHFAAEVYKNEEKFEIPDGWELLITVTNTELGNGCVMAAFFRLIQQQIIIAIRGTNGLSDYNSWWNNWEGVVKCSISPQIRSALTFADFIRDVIVELRSEKKWRYQLSFTGHSLGGFLAHIITFGVEYLQRNGNVFLKTKPVARVHAHCVTLDNPGCAEMLDRITDHCNLRYLKTIFPSTLDITAYLSAPNMVNMCNRHVGVLLRLKLSFKKMSFITAHTPLLYDDETHKMNTIKSAFYRDGNPITVEADQILDWPVAYLISEEKTGVFECSNRKNNFCPDLNKTVVPIGEDRFNTIRYYSRKHSLDSCNVSLFSEDELSLLERWLIVQSPVTINEMFSPLKQRFNALFSKFERTGNSLKFDDEASMKQTIKRCKQIVRWYPEEIKTCLRLLETKYHDVIMKVAVDFYNESFNNCNVHFKDSIKLEAFLKARENVLLIKPCVNNCEIEMLRLFDVFKQIKSKQNVIIDKYTGNDNFLFVNQPYLLSLFKHTAGVDLAINSQLKLIIVDLLNKTVNDDVSNLIKGFANDDRKVVIVNGSNIDLSEISREIASPEFKFTDLTEKSQEWALDKKIIKFRNETYSLATFFKAANDKWTEDSPIVNDYQFLDLLLNDRCIELKYESLNLSSLGNFYIQAYKDQSYSYDDFVKLIDENPECDLMKSKILITHVCDTLNFKITCDKLQTADLNEASQYFKERCNEDSSKKFYWFHYDQKVSLQQIYNTELYIPRSFYYEMVLDETKVTDSIKEELSRQENGGVNNRVTVELTNTDNRSVQCNFRVNRESDKIVYVWDGKDNNNEIKDVRDFLTISRDCSLTEQELVDRGLVLITGDPGIGKSTTVANLISEIKRSCVFKLTYNDCATIVTRLNGNFEIDRISEQLLKIKTNDECDFLKYHLAGKTAIRVVFLFDEIFDSSYDEKYERPIIEFLQYLRYETESLIIVTSRENKREMLEDALKTFSIQFERLERKDVEGYLTNYWSDLFHLDLTLKRLTLDGLNVYIKRLLDKATEVFDRKILNFVGIPLQMKLLAEVAAPDFSSLSKPSPDGIPLELPDSLTGIFQAFVDKKLAIFWKKLRLGDSYSVKKVYLEWIDKQLRAFSATKYGFYDDNFQELQILQETGLIQGSEFIHQTIQEFYFARQIFFWLKKRNGRHGGKRPELAKFLVQEVFSSGEFSIVRMFLETYVSQITPELAPFYSRKIIEKLNNDSISGYSLENILYILIRENCQGIAIFLLESFKKHHEQAFVSLLTVNKSCETAVLFNACECNQTPVIDFFVQLLEKQSTETLIRFLIGSFYQWPVQESLDALENFIARIPAAWERNVKEIFDLIKKEMGLFADFMLAAKNGSLEIVRNCLTNVSDTLKPHLLNFRSDFSGDSALHLAVRRNHREIVRLLIEHGANVNQVNSDGMTPIAFACKCGNLKILRYLIEHGGDYKKGDYYRITPFYRAATRGHVEIVKYFLDELKYEEVNLKNWYGDTALHNAIRSICEDEDENWYGDTALHNAIRSICEDEDKDGDEDEDEDEDGDGDEDEGEDEDEDGDGDGDGDEGEGKGEDEDKRKVVELLLKHDGNAVNAENSEGWRPLDIAVKMRNFELIEMFVKAGATINYDNYYDYRSGSLIKGGSNIINKRTTVSLNPIVAACEYGKEKTLRCLIENGGDYKKEDYDGITPFHRAAAKGRVDIVKYFLDELKYEEVKDRNGSTALHCVIRNICADEDEDKDKYEDERKVVEILLKHDGIDVNAENNYGRRPLDYVTKTRDFELIEMIVKAGATIDFEDYYDYDDAHLIEPGSNVTNSMTEIADACDTGNLKMLRRLIENGGDYKNGDTRGVTPFHRAAMGGHVDIVKYFLDELKYREVNRKDSYGDTALHRAAMNKHTEVVDLLLKHGIDANAENCLGVKPFQVAYHWRRIIRFHNNILEAGVTVNRNDYKRLPIKMLRRYTPKDIVKFLKDLKGKRPELAEQKFE